MDRKRQQADLFFQLGQLFGPVLKMSDNPASYDSDERTRILARFFADLTPYTQAFQQFTVGEPGHNYLVQYYNVVNATGCFPSPTARQDTSLIYQEAKTLHGIIFDAIYSIPVSVESTIHEACTPFSTYCCVKDLCSTVTTEIVWMDRYFDHTLFHRYFVDTPQTVAITLVTFPQSKCSSNKDQQRYSEFMALSKLFAQERGLQAYRLITDDQFHDRWLRCDDKMLAIGGSIKDLGKDSTFTISKLDGINDNRKQFEEAIQRGTEIFGPNHTAHP